MLVVFFTLLGLFVIGWFLIKSFNSSLEAELNDNPSSQPAEDDPRQPPKKKQER